MKYACHDDVVRIVDIKRDQVPRLSHDRRWRTVDTRPDAMGEVPLADVVN
jgi:hypothetical protein